MAESLEYKALLSCLDNLVTALKFDPASLSVELAAKGLVPPDLRTNSDPAHELAGCILNRVKLAPNRYHDVLEVLSRHQWLQDFVKILQAAHEQLKEDVPRSKEASIDELSYKRNIPDELSCQSDIDGSVFQPDLGEIPLRATSFKIPNPVVHTSDLDEDDEEDLYAQINELTRKIEIKFGKLFDRIFTSFRDSRDVDCDRLVVTLINRERLFKEGELSEATSVSDVFKAIRPYCSYFNYDILETLVQVNGSSKERRYLKKYIQAFSAYCKAVPCIEKVCGSDHEEAGSKRTKLKFKLDFDREQLKPDAVRSIKYNIAKHLGVRPSALYLCRIDEGCVSLEFLVPTFILEDILPALTDAQKTALHHDVKALAIECKDLNVNIQFPRERRSLLKSKEENHHQDKSQHHSRASRVGLSAKKYMKWIRQFPMTERRARATLYKNYLDRDKHCHPLYCPPEHKDVDDHSLHNYACGHSATAISGVSASSDPHVPPSFEKSYDLHHSSPEQHSCGEGSSPLRRNLKSPSASCDNILAYLLLHQHEAEQPNDPASSGFLAGATAMYLQYAHSQPQRIIHASAREAQQTRVGHGSSHPYYDYHLIAKSHLDSISTNHEETAAHRRTNSLPDLSARLTTKISKQCSPFHCKHTKSLPDLSAYSTSDANRPGTPVHCKPVFLRENTLDSEPFATGYWPPNLQLVKEISRSADNVPATSYPFTYQYVKKGQRPKKVGRRSRPRWNYASQMQSGIDMDYESSSHHSDCSSGAPADSNDEGIGLWRMNQKPTSHRKTPATSELPFSPHSKTALENIRRASRGQNKLQLSSQALSHRPIHSSGHVPFMHGSPSLLPSIRHSHDIITQGSGRLLAPYETVVTAHNGVVTKSTEC